MSAIISTDNANKVFSLSGQKEKWKSILQEIKISLSKNQKHIFGLLSFNASCVAFLLISVSSFSKMHILEQTDEEMG
ncbi:CLUMA_CG000432, isoform A [Clunio marinus]|uniref:CLUMA_CG000432, isoform A n=1 Tax=Clunio marinus TaxID=568069 RepID=A0A1J1HEG6_9DIPT|nr:CLUMA_CG000432, isoform A [Clunio marinus]